MDAATNRRVEEALKHFGIKGMHWGQHKIDNAAAERVAKDFTIARKSGLTPTKKTFKGNVDKAGGLHKVSDEQLKRMLDRLQMEKKFQDIQDADKIRRKEGRAAALRILAEFGKAALPAIIQVVNERAGGGHNNGGHPGTFRTNTVNPRVIEGVAAALGR